MVTWSQGHAMDAPDEIAGKSCYVFLTFLFDEDAEKQRLANVASTRNL